MGKRNSISTRDKQVSGFIKEIGSIRDDLFVKQVIPDPYVTSWVRRNPKTFEKALQVTYHSSGEKHFINAWFKYSLKVYKMPIRNSKKGSKGWLYSKRPVLVKTFSCGFGSKKKGKKKRKKIIKKFRKNFDPMLVRGQLGNFINPQLYVNFQDRPYKPRTRLANRFYWKSGANKVLGSDTKLKDLQESLDEILIEKDVTLPIDLFDPSLDPAKYQKDHKRLTKAEQVIRGEIEKRKRERKFHIRPSWKLLNCSHYFLSSKPPLYLKSLLEGYQEDWCRKSGKASFKLFLEAYEESKGLSEELLSTYDLWDISWDEFVRRVSRASVRRAIQKEHGETMVLRLHERNKSLLPDPHILIPLYQMEENELVEVVLTEKELKVIGETASREMLKLFEEVTSKSKLNPFFERKTDFMNWAKRLRKSWSDPKACKWCFSYTVAPPEQLFGRCFYMNHTPVCDVQSIKYKKRKGLVFVRSKRSKQKSVERTYKPHDFVDLVLGSNQNKNRSLRTKRTGYYRGEKLLRKAKAKLDIMLG